MKIKKIVCFGGGSAMPETILEPLKKYPLKISSVSSMVDNGGSTGALCKEFDILPPGDIRRHILAFSEAPKWKKELWQLRFGKEEFEDGHKGHNFANVFIAGLERKLKDYSEVLRECSVFMEIPKKYKPLPATLSKTVLCAELQDGEIAEGESEIDVPREHDANLKIKRIFLKPSVRACKETLAAIQEADVLIFGPGDLYSSILPCFLPVGIRAEIFKSKAKKILVCNIMRKKGETNDFCVEDFARETEKYIGTKLDYVLYNNNIPGDDIVETARQEDASLLEPVAFGKDLDEKKFCGMNLVKKNTVLHNARRTGEAVWRIL